MRIRFICAMAVILAIVLATGFAVKNLVGLTVGQKTNVIHYVNYRARTTVDAGLEAYLEKQDIPYRIVYHNVDRNPANVPGIMKTIRDDKEASLVITWGTTVTLMMFGKTDDTNGDFIRDIDGIFTLVTDPVGANIVPTLASSGRNITGSWHVAPASNQFRAMMVYRPAKKIGILYTPTEQNSVVYVKRMTEVAAVQGVSVIAIPFNVEDGIPNSANAPEVLRSMKRQGVEWLYLPPDSFLGTQTRDLVIPEANRLGIPTFASTEQLMQTGATFGLLCPYWEVGILLGKKAKLILKDGLRPADIPIDTVERFTHQMNKEAAEKLGFKLAPAMLNSIMTVVAP